MSLIRVEVESQLQSLLKEHDLNHDYKITVQEGKQGVFKLETLEGQLISIEGVYPLSNLLQLLAQAHQAHHKQLQFDLSSLYQNPIDLIYERITKLYWKLLTRNFTKDSLILQMEDSKIEKGRHNHLYISIKDIEAREVFEKLAHEHPYLKLKTHEIPTKLTAAFLNRVIKKPGLVSLSLRADVTNENPYVVPGGRFNEMYGWDSYFIIEGLILSDHVSLAYSMCQHLLYQVEHFGHILNANRSYYLSRSQPPFLSKIVRTLSDHYSDKAWLANALNLLIQDYTQTWMSKPRLTETGLSRYYDLAEGEPIEVEEDHFQSAYRDYAKRYQITVEELKAQYSKHPDQFQELNEYFIHDRSMRESGHDTTSRLVCCSAHLNPVDLNCLLYQYEKDIEYLIDRFFNGSFIDAHKQAHTSSTWAEKAQKRAQLMKGYCFNSEKGIFEDYQYKDSSLHQYDNATLLYPLFTGLATPDEAESIINYLLPKLETKYGVLSCVNQESSEIGQTTMRRQWDYPFGWAPHQIIAWKGLMRYGYREIAQRLASKWLKLIAQVARDYNGAIVEKYDLSAGTHLSTAEYGNEGLNFKYSPPGGFAWTNASFVVGMNILSESQLNALKAELAIQ